MKTEPSSKPQLSATLLSYFYFTALLSITVDLGLSSALKGAAVGNGEYIAQSVHVGALFSQFTALSASTILVFASLRCLSRLYKNWEIWPAAFLALGAQLLLFIAMQGRLGLSSVVLMSLCSGLSLLLISLVRTSAKGRFVTATGSLVMLASGLSFYSWPPAAAATLNSIFSLLSQALQWLVVLGLLISLTRRSRLLVGLTLCSGLLLAQGAIASSHSNAPTALVIMGRIIEALTRSNSRAYLEILPLCWTLCLAFLQLFTAQKVKERLLTLGALAVFLPVTPLALGLALSVGWCRKALSIPSNEASSVSKKDGPD